jgi:hypothetical protein
MHFDYHQKNHDFVKNKFQFETKNLRLKLTKNMVLIQINLRLLTNKVS